MQVSDRLRKSTAGYTHWCPACKRAHAIAVDQPNAKGAKWVFDNNLKKPTFSPSVFINYNDAEGQLIGVCHYHLVKGVLYYQADSTHGFAGHKVELPVLPHGLRDKE